MRHRSACSILIIGLVAACSDGTVNAGGEEARMAMASEAPVQVDSVFPMDVMIERFQAVAGPAPAVLGNAAPSREALVARLIQAVEDDDAAALRALRLDAAEYGYLYFPTSHLAREPYRQPPELGWMLTEQNGLKGETRLLRKYGGQQLGYTGHQCAAEPVTEGANVLWQDCVVRVPGEDEPVRLFGTILERDGRFKFISLSNDL